MNRLVLLAALLLAATPVPAQTRDGLLGTDRAEAAAAGNWIYNDLQMGFTEAARTRKAMLVVFRCVP